MGQSNHLKGLIALSAYFFLGAYIQIEDEGVARYQRQIVNFTGAGVSCTDAGGKTVCAIGGGSGGAPDTAEFITYNNNASLSADVFPSAADQVPVSDTSSTATWRVLVDSDALTQCLQYDVATNAFSAGTTVGATVETAEITDDNVSYAKLPNVTASRLLGRGSAAGAGDPQEITLGTNLSMTGTTLDAAAGGGGTFLEATVDFSVNGSLSCTASLTPLPCCTGASVGTCGSFEALATIATASVTGTSKIICAPTLFATADRLDASDDALLDEIDVMPYARNAGVNFKVKAHAPRRAFGKFVIQCTLGA